jgi:hypothetical protein
MVQSQGKGVTLPVVDCLLAATALQQAILRWLASMWPIRGKRCDKPEKNVIRHVVAG